MRRRSSRNGPCLFPFPVPSITAYLNACFTLSGILGVLNRCVHRYNDDISLEDAIHTALLTLKEGFEGQMTEKTIEIGVVTVPNQAELEAGKVEGTGRYKPTFRKLTEEEIRDYLAL